MSDRLSLEAKLSTECLAGLGAGQGKDEYTQLAYCSYGAEFGAVESCPFYGGLLDSLKAEDVYLCNLKIDEVYEE